MLVGSLPTPFPAPIVVAQHLDPNRPSRLGEILSRRSTIPVKLVNDVAPLEPGTVFVVPSDRHIHIDDHTIRVVDSRPRPKPSVDMLMSTAAPIYGESLIAVILTGSGSDGAAGAREVKRYGGTVIIQNPATARFSGMPSGPQPNLVDIVADLEKIGPLLHQLLTGEYTPPVAPGEDPRVAALLEQVRERSGIDFAQYKPATILRRLKRRIAATDSGDLEGYARYLVGHPDEYQRLVNSFLIKVTEFMRDPDLFAYLRETLLPELIEHARKRGNELRIW